jgi:hypothetical protein
MLKEELDELTRLRSASKTSKFNDKYLTNNKYYPVLTEHSPDGKRPKVEDRLNSFGSQTKKKIE